MDFKYTVNPNSATPIMLINKHIGKNANGEEGIMGDRVAREVLALKEMGKKEIDVWINSSGGNVREAMDIYSTFTDSGLKVNTHNKGVVDSAAGWVFQAGTTRIWPSYGLGLIHEVQNGGDVDVEEVNNSIATMLAKRSGKSIEDIRQLMAKDTIMGAKMAEQYGFYDKLVNYSHIETLTNSSDIEAVKALGNTEINKSLPKNQGMSKTICTLLGLQNEASSDSQLQAIELLVNENTTSKTAITTLTNDLANVNKSLAETTGKLTESQTKLTELENANKKVEAAAMVQEHVGKRIPNDKAVIDMWVNKATSDFDGTKALIETITVNSRMPNPTHQDTDTVSAVPVDVASWRASLNKNK